MNLDNWFIPFLDFSDSNDSNCVREGQRYMVATAYYTI